MVGREDLRRSSGSPPSQSLSSLWPRGCEVVRYGRIHITHYSLCSRSFVLRYPDLRRFIDDKLGHHSFLIVLFPGYPMHLLDRNCQFVCYRVSDGLCFGLCFQYRYPPQQSCPYEKRYPESELLVDGDRKGKQCYVEKIKGLISSTCFSRHRLY